MPRPFALSGTIKLTDLPDQIIDFRQVTNIVDDTCGRDASLYIRNEELVANIDVSDASYRVYDALQHALDKFLTKHAAEGAAFDVREDGETWYFGPTPQAKWQAQFDHLQSLAIAADEALGEWLEHNPKPEPK